MQIILGILTIFNYFKIIRNTFVSIVNSLKATKLSIITIWGKKQQVEN